MIPYRSVPFLWYDAEPLDDHLERYSLVAQGLKQPVPLFCVGVAAAVGTASRQPLYPDSSKQPD